MEFICDESCGKCSPCRIGTKRILEILTRITEGKGTMEDLDTLEELSKTIQKNSLCALGQTAANPVNSTLRHFRDEYIAHIVEKRCPAHVCKSLMQLYKGSRVRSFLGTKASFSSLSSWKPTISATLRTASP